jgi:hypothetical protein
MPISTLNFFWLTDPHDLQGKISYGGGWIVRWDKRGGLFFLTTDDQVMKAELNLSAHSLQVQSLRPLFQINLADTPAPLFDVTSEPACPGGAARAGSSSISVLLNRRGIAAQVDCAGERPCASPKLRARVKSITYKGVV